MLDEQEAGLRRVNRCRESPSVPHGPLFAACLESHSWARWPNAAMPCRGHLATRCNRLRYTFEQNPDTAYAKCAICGEPGGVIAILLPPLWMRAGQSVE